MEELKKDLSNGQEKATPKTGVLTGIAANKKPETKELKGVSLGTKEIPNASPPDQNPNFTPDPAIGPGNPTISPEMKKAIEEPVVAEEIAPELHEGLMDVGPEKIEEHRSEELQLTPEALQEIAEKVEQQEVERALVKAATVHYNNEKNVWRLISKTANDRLAWENTVTAMEVTHGIIVCTKEGIANRTVISTVYIAGGKMILKNGKYFI